MDKKLFRGYDVRGKYPKEIDERVVAEISSGLAKSFDSGELVLGHDARRSSPKLYKAAIRAIEAANPKLAVVKLGLVSTPLLYFLVNKVGAEGGIMITASHNPKNYNGLKVVGRMAEPWSGGKIYKTAFGR